MAPLPHHSKCNAQKNHNAENHNALENHSADNYNTQIRIIAEADSYTEGLIREGSIFSLGLYAAATGSSASAFAGDDSNAPWSLLGRHALTGMLQRDSTIHTTKTHHMYNVCM